MHFGKKLLERRHQPWAQYYIDYSRLKTILEESSDDDDGPTSTQLQSPRTHNQALTSQRSSLTAASLRHSFRGATTLTFQLELDRQVRKVVLFLLQKQGAVAKQLTDIMIPFSVEDPQRQQDQQLLLGIAAELLHLVEFVDLNVTGIRKILKKHDKVTRGKRVLSQRYLFPASSKNNELIQPLLEYGGLDAMIRTLQVVWEDHFDMPGDDAVCTTAGYYGSADNKETVKPAMPNRGSGNSNILGSIYFARHKLQTTSDFVNMLAAQTLLEESSEGDDGGGDGRSYKIRQVSNWLNFCSTFLHLTDYYVVAPGCGSYAKLMGGDESLAGVIIGMNSVAALVSTLIYSFWTSSSYKGPLVCATTCQIIGVIVYALALPWGGSLKLVMLGRLLSGFGSARALNRRYIADTYSPAERTAASATFVTAGALGTSAGPALAATLYKMVPHTPASLYWLPENAPCWVMALVWSVYLVLVLLFFEEPEHISKVGMGSTKPAKLEMSVHHEEQARLLEELETATNSERSSSGVQPLWNNRAVMLTFTIYFVLKFILESLLSSSAMLTGYYFEWSDRESGSYLAIIGLLILPVNWVIALMAQRYDDRELIVVLEGFILFGCLSILDIPAIGYSVAQYVFASVVIFVSTNALEGPTMSLLSKVIPGPYRRGFWNVGLFATEAGTLGRAVGDVILTLCGSAGLEYVLNNAFGTMSVLALVSIFVTQYFYADMDTQEKDL